jgi:hypothetical protein
MENCDHQIMVDWYPPNGHPPFLAIVKCTRCNQFLGVIPNNAAAVNDIMTSITTITQAINTRLAKIEEFLKTIAEKK